MSEVKEKEKIMSMEKIYRSDKFQLCITIDRENMLLMASDYILGEFYPNSAGRLLEASDDLAEELEKLFEIKIEEYEVKRTFIEPIIYREGESDG